MADPEDDLTERWLELTRQLSLRMSLHGHHAVEVVFRYPWNEEHRMAIPPPRQRLLPLLGVAAAEPTPDEWASGPAPRHNDDWTVVYWPSLLTADGESAGPVFTFNPTQAGAVKALWEARYGGGHPDVSQDVALRACGSRQPRLGDLFRARGRTHPAWGVLLLPGERPATFRLPSPPVAEEGAA